MDSAKSYKLAKLKTTNQLLDEKYGKHGTATREAFNEKTMAWYYGDILRNRRKELKLTQKQLAQKSVRSKAILPVLKKARQTYSYQVFFALLVHCVLSLHLHLFDRFMTE